MRKNIFVGLVIALFSLGCATQPSYNLHGFYKSKNNSLKLVSKLDIFKSGNYVVCTSTLDHEKELPGDGNYCCISGSWKQEKNKVTFTADTYEGKLEYSLPEDDCNAILVHVENVANPTTLSILQSSGATMSDSSITGTENAKTKLWGNYERYVDPVSPD
jgi:hypothetical protein